MGAAQIGVLAIIQARVESQRFPAKVLQTLGGMPMIEFMINRVRRAGSIDQLVLATSTAKEDDRLASVAADLGVAVVRGSQDDVLMRFAQALDQHPAQVIVRLTGDCPLIDPCVVDRVIDCVVSGGAEYASNIVPPTYPDGLDCEAFTAALLQRAAREAVLLSEREHVTPWIQATAGSQAQTVACSVDLSGLRWTVDYADDLDLVRRMVDYLGPRATEADLFDLLRAYDRVDKPAAHHDRNEGYAKSLASDGAFD